MNKQKETNQKELRRKARTRAKIFGDAKKPRLSVFRSNKAMALQLIDDVKGHTLVSAYAREVEKTGNKTSKSTALGVLLAEKMKKIGITEAVFDRGSHPYHGRIKAVADAVRQAGIKI